MNSSEAYDAVLPKPQSSALQRWPHRSILIRSSDFLQQVRRLFLVAHGGWGGGGRVVDPAYSSNTCTATCAGHVDGEKSIRRGRRQQSTSRDGTGKWKARVEEISCRRPTISCLRISAVCGGAKRRRGSWTFSSAAACVSYGAASWRSCIGFPSNTTMWTRIVILM